ncbi:hypothetical protein MSAN_00010000 [Mycena sanguinolenta]|uniref:Uncharacterized protein n=1 Tax=Mycena sanguinolenta TaxID=230812 RepID=A0A8H7DHU1_9AGAR|nr:hypothetical protein MSAN_00010000 [Mycena sanguinolenta]
MSPASFEPRSRAFIIIVEKCFNENGQAIACPVPRWEGIVFIIFMCFAAVFLGFFCWFKCCGCGCRCRKRRQKNAIPIPNNSPSAFEAQSIAPRPYKPYKQVKVSLTSPASPPYRGFDRFSKDSESLSPGSHSERLSTETLVEPSNIYPAHHIYPGN